MRKRTKATTRRARRPRRSPPVDGSYLPDVASDRDRYLVQLSRSMRDGPDGPPYEFSINDPRSPFCRLTGLDRVRELRRVLAPIVRPFLTEDVNYEDGTPLNNNHVVVDIGDGWKPYFLDIPKTVKKADTRRVRAACDALKWMIAIEHPRNEVTEFDAILTIGMCMRAVGEFQRVGQQASSGGHGKRKCKTEEQQKDAKRWFQDKMSQSPTTKREAGIRYVQRKLKEVHGIDLRRMAMRDLLGLSDT